MHVCVWSCVETPTYIVELEYKNGAAMQSVLDALLISERLEPEEYKDLKEQLAKAEEGRESLRKNIEELENQVLELAEIALGGSILLQNFRNF